MDYETIIYNLTENILIITLNRPEKLNALNGQMSSEILHALDRADSDDNVKAIIFTGQGRAFCAGADLSGGSTTFDYDSDGRGIHPDGGGILTLRLFECLKPVISACNGPAVGVGATMQCAMDVRMASENARYGFVFSKRGIVPEACSSWFLPRCVGISTALEWTYSGRIFDASEAMERKFVRSVHKEADLLAAAKELAHEFTEQTSSISVSMIRHMMWKMLGADHPMEAHKVDSRGVYFTGKSGDAHEGVQSFLEKRPPKFKDKVSENMPEFFPWWERRKFE
ncbi:MAG: enoyl-CoA hydratase [Gammaproteobacteria bacterium]|nr:enoyl-CoA hydratase [Gammaproteobacteria bacterium]